ncbi:hypothetical protein AMK59_8312, partial [Oryctes borbonicus]
AIDEKPVATLLMSFSRGCGAVLDLIQLPESSNYSDGYHSEPEQETDKEKDAIGRYASLYYQSRPRALESLNSLPDLQQANQLKSKILFSVVVLAFRTCKQLKDVKFREICRSLHIDFRTLNNISLRSCIAKCLAVTSNTFPLHDVEQQIRVLVCGTLQEYKCLDTCEGLRSYIADVTRTVWFLVNQESAFDLDTNFQTPVKFQTDKHQRHHSSDRNSDNVKNYLWPALLQFGNCVQKAVVVTS